MTEGIDIDKLRDQFARNGNIVATGPDKGRLFIVSSYQMGMEERGVLISYEGEGAFFWTLDRPLNQFRLVQGGFSANLAPTLAEILNRLFQAQEGRVEWPMIGSSNQSTSDV